MEALCPTNPNALARIPVVLRWCTAGSAIPTLSKTHATTIATAATRHSTNAMVARGRRFGRRIYPRTHCARSASNTTSMCLLCWCTTVCHWLMAARMTGEICKPCATRATARTMRGMVANGRITAGETRILTPR